MSVANAAPGTGLGAFAALANRGASGEEIRDPRGRTDARNLRGPVMQSATRSRPGTSDYALPRRQSEPGGAAAARTPGSRRRVRKRTSRSRLLRSALAIVVLTWVPAALGVALHLSLFRAWGVASGYAGLSWALPASLVGLAAAREARDGGLPGQRALGVVAGVAAAIVLVIGAASVAGADRHPPERRALARVRAPPGYICGPVDGLQDPPPGAVDRYGVHGRCRDTIGGHAHGDGLGWKRLSQPHRRGRRMSRAP